MGSQRREATYIERLTSSAMATFMPHLLVQLIALFAASGGFIVLALSEWPGVIFASLFLLFQVCLHFFIKSTNSYTWFVPSKPLRVAMQVVQSAFVVMGIIALCILFWWLFEWSLFQVYEEHHSGGFYFDLQGMVLSLVPDLVWIGLIGEALRRFFPLLKQGKRQLNKYLTTWG